MNPASQGKHLLDVWGSAADNLFATGSGGIVLRYDGEKWRHTTTPVAQNINAVWGADATHVFAVGGSFEEDGVILFFDGTSWTKQTIPATDGLNDVWGSSATDVYAVGQKRKVLHFDGASWQAVGVTPGIEPLRSIWGSNARDIYATGLGTSLLHYDGDSWDEVPTGASFSLNAVWGTDSIDVFVVGGNGAASHYDGDTWSNIDIGEGLFPTTVWGTETTDVYAMGFAAGAASSAYHWDGFSWSPVEMRSVKGINSMFGVDGVVIAVGQGGLIHEQVSDGFAAMTGGLTADLDAVWVAPAGNEAFAVGERGTILHFKNGAWSPMTSGTASRLRGLGGNCTCNLFAVGENGVVLHYNGVDWADASPGIAAHFNEAWMDPVSGVTFVVGDGGTVMRHENGGWTPLSLVTVTQNLLSVWGSSSSNVYVVGSQTTALRWTGTQFKDVVIDPPNTQNFHTVFGTGANDVFVGSELISPPASPAHGGGKIHHWDGTEWTIRHFDPINDVLAVWRTGAAGFAGGNPSSLKRSSGASGWEAVFDVVNLPFYVNSVWGSSMQNVFIVGSDGAIIRYSP